MLSADRRFALYAVTTQHMDEIHLGELTVADVDRVVLHHRTGPAATEAGTAVGATDGPPVDGHGERPGADRFRTPIGNSYTGRQVLR